ncbi:MAG: tetratricopeptide repeat protein [Pseudomonadales bacterium]|nr:tetratricopeptide repeat protein [Pseudomonadales bacterium]
MYRQLLTFLIVATMLGCTGDSGTQRVGLPVQAGFDSPDEELASFLKGMYKEALENPESGVARGRLGIAYDINQQIEAARLSYEQAEALDPDEFLWPYYRSLLLADRGEHELALELLDRAQALDPGYLPAWLWRGTYLNDLNRDEAAATAFLQAIALKDEPPARIGLARTLLRRGKPDDAVRLLEPLAEKFRHPLVYRLLGRGYRALGKGAEAEIALMLGRDAGPLVWDDERKFAQWDYVRGFRGRLGYAKLLVDSHRAEDALAVLESLRERDPNDEALLHSLSVAYAEVGKVDESFEVLMHALEVYPGSFSSHFHIAHRYQIRGNVELALEHVERAVELSPDLSPGHELMGEILIGRGDYHAAMVAFDKALSPKGYYYMAMVEGSREDWPKAIAYFEKSVALDPSDAKSLIYFGRSLAEDGRYQESRTTLLKAQQLGAHPNDFASALRRLAELESGR